jgi:NAD(P)-dependent dehydrogenase (short-subunit alcohol dehydrogenase family)
MEILITGANRGIGATLRASYLARGHRATGTARHPQSGPGWLTMDVSDAASITAAARDYGDKPLDLLICNAGVYPDKAGGPRAYAPDQWAQGFAVNVMGVFLTVDAFLPTLHRAAAPKIAIIASQMGSSKRAPGGSYIYRASKAAAINLGRNLATDLAADGIAVGIYHPGWVQTDMGGPKAQIDSATSADGLIARFDTLSPATTGVFEDYTGAPLDF